MKLFEEQPTFDPKRFIYALQQELIELEPGLDVEIKQEVNHAQTGWQRRHNEPSYSITVTAADLTYVSKLNMENDGKWALAPWLSSTSVREVHAPKTYAAAILYQLKQELVTQCPIIVNDDVSDLASRPFQVWLEGECFSLFKYLLPGATRRLAKGTGTLNLVVLDTDKPNLTDEAGLQELQTRYNSTIVATKKLRNGYEAFLLAQLEN